MFSYEHFSSYIQIFLIKTYGFRILLDWITLAAEEYNERIDISHSSMESFDFVVAPFLWYSWVPLRHEVTPSAKETFERELSY